MKADSGKTVSSCTLLVIAIVVSKALITASTTTASDVTTATDFTDVTEIVTALTPSSLTTSEITNMTEDTSTSSSVTTSAPITVMTTSITNTATTRPTSNPSSSSSSLLSPSSSSLSTTEIVSGPSETSTSLHSSTTSGSPDEATTISTSAATEISTIAMITSATDMTTNTNQPSTMSLSSPPSNTFITTEIVSGPSETSTSLHSSTTSEGTDGGTTISTSVTTESTIAMNTSATDMTTNTNQPSTMSLSSALSNTFTSTEMVTDGDATTSTSSSSTTTTEASTATSDSSTKIITSEPPSSSPSVSTTVTTETKANLTTGLSTTKPATEPPTEPQTDPRTEPPTEPNKVGPVPEPTFPELGENAMKTYRFEFAVNENTTEGCMSSNLSSPACEIFKDDITLKLVEVYSDNEAYLSVEVELRAGSVIVSHDVTFSYNNMTEEEKMASPQDIYDQTLGEAVADGTLGNYTVIENCNTCAPPEETSNICDSDEPRCPADLMAVCRQNYWACESICLIETDYCNDNGICWQNSNGEPLCSCDWDKDHWYWGYNCQYYVDQMYLIIGCSCGGAVLIVLLVSIFAYVYAKNKESHKKKSSSSDNDEDVINAFQNLGYDHSETVFPPIDDMDDGDILQRRRPYSYIYTKGEDLTNMESGSSFTKTQNGRANQRDSRLDVNEDAAKRLSNLSNGSSDIRHSSFLKSNGGPQERNPEFWGNLNDQPTEHIKLEPVLDHIDVNESYKIQRPMISPNYSYANTSATPNVYQSIDSPQSQHLPDPDYAQR